MIYFALFVIVPIILYLVINGRRNSDPFNRKCAAEICEYLMLNQKSSCPNAICRIFLANARYKGQANHIVSMVPALLIEEGVPYYFAMSTVPILKEAAALIPK